MTGSLWRAPQTRASRATAWLASGSEEPAAARTRASSSRDPRLAQRLAQPAVEHVEEARLEAEDVGRRGPVGRGWRWRPPRRRGDVHLRVVGVAEQQRHDDDLVEAGLTSRSITVSNDGLGQLEEGLLDAQVGAQLRTSATSASMVAAERGSRLPWASATSAGAVMGFLSSGRVSCVVVATAVGVDVRRQWWMPHSVLPVPAQRPLRGPRRGRPAGAGPAADGRVSVVLQRVDQDAVLGDVPLDLVVAPARERGDLDLLLLVVPADDGGDHPAVGLVAAQPRRPCVVPGEGVRSGLTLRSAQHRSGSVRKRSLPYSHPGRRPTAAARR